MIRQLQRRVRQRSASRSRRATRRASISGIREKHGLPYPPLRSSTEGIDRFLTKNTRVGIRRTQDGYDVYAPDGFDDIAGMIVRPNPGPNFSAANYAEKAARWKALWPEITVLPAEVGYPSCGEANQTRHSAMVS